MGKVAEGEYEMTRKGKQNQKPRQHQLLWKGCTTEAHGVLRIKVKSSKKCIIATWKCDTENS